MSYWEVYRGSSVDQSTLNFKVTCFITDIMTEVCLTKSLYKREVQVFCLLKSKTEKVDQEHLLFVSLPQLSELHVVPNDTSAMY